MGSNVILSHASEEERNIAIESNSSWSCLRFWKRRKSKRGAHTFSTELQPTQSAVPCADVQHVNHASLVSNVSSSFTTTATCDIEKSDKRTTLQRTLPAIPGIEKDKIESIYESAPILTELGADLGASVRQTLSKCDDAPKPCPQTSTHPADDRENEVGAYNKQEDPRGKLCTAKESVRHSRGYSKPTMISSTLMNVSGHSEEVTSPEQPDDRRAAAGPEAIYAEMDRRRDSEIPDVTYMQIDGADDNGQADRKKATSESNENGCQPEVATKNDECEDGYTRGHLNVNAAAGKSTQTTTKTQAIVGPNATGSRKNQDPVALGIVVHPPPVQPGSKRTLSETTTVEIEAKKTKAFILLKTDFGPNSCMFMVRVLLGCLEDGAQQQKMVKALRLYDMEGFQMLEDIAFDLFAGDSKSKVSVKISKIQWTDGDVIHGDLDAEEFGWRELWNYGSRGAKFWQMSRMMNGGKPEVFAATVHIQQDDRQDIGTKLFRLLESPLQLSEQRHTPVDKYSINQSCDQPAIHVYNTPKGEPLLNVYRSSFCNSDDKKDDIVSLHADSSMPEPRASPPLDRVKKDIEREKAVKPWPTAEGIHYPDNTDSGDPRGFLPGCRCGFLTGFGRGYLAGPVRCTPRACRRLPTLPVFAFIPTPFCMPFRMHEYSEIEICFS